MKLELRNVAGGYGSAVVVQDIELTVERGTCLALLGRNGMGKSTLVKAVLGFLPRTSGSVRFGDRDVLGWPASRIVRLGVAYGPQEEAVFGELTVDENLAAATLRRRPSAARRAQVLEFFPVLAERGRQRAGTLSGGEQKMLVLARSLLAEPAMLVLDEISAGLQPSMVAAVERALRWERQHRGTTVLMVEQNLDLSLGVADRVAVLKLGRIGFQAAANDAGIRDELLRQLAP